MARIGDHAVVLGASMGGLLAARVLADAYDRVTVVERDKLPTEPEQRRGVPQGRHVHALLAGGAQALEELMPGLLGELIDAGAKVLAQRDDIHFSPAGGRLLTPQKLNPPAYQPSRPFLEAGVRARIRAMHNVRIVDNCDVVGLTTDDARERVTGVRVQRHSGGGAEQAMPADLVVDATGRGARMPAWLAELGYERPVEDEVPIHVRYASQPVRLRPGAVPEKLVLFGPVPERPTGMGLFAYEDDTWLFTAFGYAGHHPAPEFERMVEAVAGFAPPHVVRALRDAEPLGDPVAFRFPASRRRRYERMSRFPHGLLVFGDALCSFNPIYGQGMSVAALQAVALRKCLRRGERNLARRFFRAAAKPVDVAWQLAAGSDLNLPQVEAPRPLPVRVINGYVGKLLLAAERDPLLTEQFVRVTSFIEKPPRLMRPSIVLRVLIGTMRVRRTVEAAAPSTTAAQVAMD